MSDDIRLDVAIRLDDTQFNREVNAILASIRRLEREAVTINVTASDAGLRGLQSQIDGLDATADVRVSVSDNDLGAVERRIDGIDGESADVRVTASNTDDLDDIEEQLNTITNLATITVALNVAGAGFEAVKGLAGTLGNISGVSGLLETNQLLLELEATTGRIIPDADRLINDIYTSGWGESRRQIAETIALAVQFGVQQDKLEEATTSALQASLATGVEANEILRTQTTLVNTGLVPSYQAAADVIVGGFQDGLNFSDDFLDSLNEYATPLAELGFSIEDVFAIFSSGREQGVFNTDFLADSLLELSIRLKETEGTAVPALEALSLGDLRQEWLDGEVEFDTFYNAIIDGLNAIEDPAERATAAANIFGTKTEDIGAQAYIDTLLEARDVIVDVDGAAADAANTLNTSLPAAFGRIGRIISTGIGEQLDETLDITGRINAVEDGLEAFFAGLDSGESFGTAAGEGLRIAGLDELQNVLSDFLIGFLQVMRDVLSVIPNSDTSGIDRLIATFGEGQFEVDLAAADDASDIEEAVRQAVDRGVNNEDIFIKLANSLEGAEIGAGASIVDILNSDDLQEQLGVVFAELQDYNFDGAIDLADAIQFSTDFVALNELPPEIIDELADAFLTASQSEDIFGDALQTQFDTALNDLNLQEALDLNELFSAEDQVANEGFINQIKGQLESNVQQALDSFDLQGARDALDLLGDEASPELDAQVNELASYLQEQFATAISEQDFNTAQFIADQIGTEELQETLDNIIAEIGVDEGQLAFLESLLPPEDVESFRSELSVVSDEFTTTNDQIKTDTERGKAAVKDGTSNMILDFDSLGTNVSLFSDTFTLAMQTATEAHNLFSDGVLIKNAMLTASLDAVLLGLNEVIAGAAVLPGVTGGGGGGTVNNNGGNTTNVNNSNTSITNINASPIGF